jgi:hypothetical protein
VAPTPPASVALDAEAALRALMATGLGRWDALVALAEAGVARGALPVPAGVPVRAVIAHAGLPQALLAFDRLAERDPHGANATLNAYLEGRRVDGELNLGQRPWLTCLPAGLEVAGPLRLDWSGLTSLPPRLRVGGDLNLEGTPLTHLPEGLEVGWNLLAAGSRIERLPEAFRFGRTLDLRHTRLQILPEGLQVLGGLMVTGTPLRALPAGLQVKLDLFAGASGIETLPAGLKVGGTLVLDGTPVRSLPKGLSVVGDLAIRDCPAWDGWIPEDTQVGGLVFTEELTSFEDQVGLSAWRKRHPLGQRP